MRKLAVFFAVFVLSLALLVTVSVRLLRSQTDVEVREVVLSGSRDAARGLTVDFTATVQSGRMLAFDTRLPLVGGALAPETDFTYGYYARDYDLYGRLSLALRDFDITMSRVGGDGDILSGVLSGSVSVNDGQLDPVTVNVARDVAARTDPGTVRTECVPLRGYINAFGWTFKGGFFVRNSLAGEAKLSRLFHVEVPEDCCLQVRISKNEQGDVVYIATGVVLDRRETQTAPFTGIEALPPLDTESLSVDTGAFTAEGDGGVWVYPSLRDGEGREHIDYALGPGLTFLPFTDSSRIDIQMNDVRLVYPTDEEPIRVTLDSGVVELVTRAGEDYVLTAVDEGTGEVLTRETLFENVPAQTRLRLQMVEKDDLHLYVLWDGRFALTEARRGVVFTGRLDAEREYTIWGDTHNMVSLINERMTDFTWDGTRLAITHGNYQEVAVFDETGLIYHAFLDYSPVWNARLSWAPHGDGYPDRYKAHPMTVSFAN